MRTVLYLLNQPQPAAELRAGESACSKRLREGCWLQRGVCWLLRFVMVPQSPWWVGVGIHLASLTASSSPAKTTLRFTRNTGLVVTDLTGQAWCHRRFSKGWVAHGLLRARRLKDTVPPWRSCCHGPTEEMPFV